MTWLAAKLFLGGLFKRVWEALTAAFKWCLGHPKEAAIIGLVCLSAWLWRGKQSALADKRSALTELQRVIDAGKQAEAEQMALNQSIQRRYEQGAKDADAKFNEGLDRGRTATDRYVESRRLPAQCAPRASDPTTPPDDPRVPKGPAPDPVVVAVDEQDVRICGDLYAYSKAAYEWAQGLSQAVP